MAERLPVYNRASRDIAAERIRVEHFLRWYLTRHGFSPTYAEITAGAQLKSTSVVRGHLDALAAAGVIERTPNVVRSIHLAKP